MSHDQVPRAWISNDIPQNTVVCHYLSTPMISDSSTQVLNHQFDFFRRFRRWTSSSEITWYLAYVAVVLALAHVSDDMDRLILGVVTVPLSQTLEYGDQSCMTAEGYKNEMEYQRYCTAAIDNETYVIVVTWALTPGQNGRHFPDDIFKCIFTEWKYVNFD